MLSKVHRKEAWFQEIGWVKILLSPNRPHIRIYINIYFLFKKNYKHLKSKRNWKNKEKVVLLLWKVSVENIARYDDIICKICCVLLTLEISQQRQRVFKNKILCQILVYICLFHVHDENQDMFMKLKRLNINTFYSH